MSCCPVPCVKYLLLIFNLLFWLAGTGVLAVGLWLRFDPKTKNLFEGDDSLRGFYIVVYILIAVGGLMMLVGFLGCCGAIQESLCMLGLFFFLLVLIFVVKLAVGIWGFSIQSKVVDNVTHFYKETYKKYKEEKQDTLRETLQLIHYGLFCCGPYESEGMATVPETCPKFEGLDLHLKDCPNAIEKFFTSKLHIIGGVGIGIGVIMLLGMIFSMMLLCAIRRSQEIV
ncbi:CD9 molecule a isoform X2 [Hemibagrus wyckioides]|uniref:CD9 molecule a isoform X2 n=1 Tax=Hemibagrus wyckioides TaxID=337641 RepID=UPI00266DAC2D|nr:CD9 molecule a isoform X2 [Hemibagrus wyckioides]XP_058244018.1 CD9 molecule a isoform X2 [Hemibagrus wyckioides]